MRIKIYQINMMKDKRGVTSQNYKETQKRGGIDPADYQCVFYGYLDCSKLKDVYAILNRRELPATYRGLPLGTSDIVVVETDVPPDWEAFLEDTSKKAYLFARKIVLEAYSMVLCHDVHIPFEYVSVGVDTSLDEEIDAITYAVGKEICVPREEVVPYLLPLVEEMTDMEPERFCEEFGVTKEEFRNSMLRRLEPQEIREMLQEQMSVEPTVVNEKVLKLCHEMASFDEACDDSFKDHAQFIPFLKRGAYFCNDGENFQKIEFDSSLAEELQGIRCIEIQPRKIPFVTYLPNDPVEIERAVSSNGIWLNIGYAKPYNDNTIVLGNQTANKSCIQFNRGIDWRSCYSTVYILGDDGKGGFTDLTDAQIRFHMEKLSVPYHTPVEAISQEMEASLDER